MSGSARARATCAELLLAATEEVGPRQVAARGHAILDPPRPLAGGQALVESEVAVAGQVDLGGAGLALLGQGIAGGEVRPADRLASGDLGVEAAGEGDRAGVGHRLAVADGGGEAGVLDEVGAEASHPGRGRPAGVQEREADRRALEQPAEPRRRHLLAAGLLVLEPEIIFLAVPEEVEHPGFPPLEDCRGQLAAKLLESWREDPSQPDRHRRPPDLRFEVRHLDRQVQRGPHIERRRAEQQHVQILGAIAVTPAFDRHDVFVLAGCQAGPVKS